MRAPLPCAHQASPRDMSAKRAHARCLEAVSLCVGAAIELAGASSAALAPEGEDDDAAALPLLTVRVTQARAVDLVSGESVVQCVGVDVLGDACASLPRELPALLRTLSVTCPAEWVATLHDAGVKRVELRTADASDITIRCYTMLTPKPDEVVREVEHIADGRTWLPPLLQTDSAPKPKELTGGGFQLELSFETASSDGAAAAAPAWRACIADLEVLIRGTALLLPACDVQLVSAAYEPASQPDAPDDDAPTALAERLICCVTGTGPGAPLLDRFMRAHGMQQLASDVEDVAADARPIAHRVAPAPLVAAGRASQDFGVGKRCVTWTVTAMLVSSSEAQQQQLNGAAAAPTDAVEDVVLPPRRASGASLYCFNQSAALAAPTAGTLSALRAKTTAADWRAAFGLSVCGCDVLAVDDDTSGTAPTPAAGACAFLRFARGSEGEGAALPTTIVLHRRYSAAGGTPPGSIAAAPLGPKNEAKLVKAALSQALHELKASTGGALSSAFERGMRSHGLPAVARAMARIMLSGGAAPLLRDLAEAVVQHHAPPLLPAAEMDEDADEEEAGDVTHARVEQALTAALLGALDSQHQPRVPKPDEPGRDAQAPAADESAGHQPEGSAEDDELQHDPPASEERPLRRGRSPALSDGGAALPITKSDDEADDIFPRGKRQSVRQQQHIIRELDAAAQPDASVSMADAAADDDDDADGGWFL